MNCIIQLKVETLKFYFSKTPTEVCEYKLELVIY